jgi:hypothetical protein
MKILRWSILGGIAYAIYKKFGPAKAPSGVGGLAATFATREAADLAIEQLVQEHGVERLAIFVEAAGDDNTAGTQPSGGDASAVGQPERDDGALNGLIRVTVSTAGHDPATLRTALSEVGAVEVRSI